MPTPTKVKLTGGVFQDSEGNVLAFGYLNMELNQDGNISGVGQIASGITLKILLDGTGSVLGTSAITLASVATSISGTAVYTGTISGGANNAFAGLTFVVGGFSTGANNGTFVCTASTATTLTLANASASSETHAATATASQAVWGNDQILPINSYYRITGYTAVGQPAWGPNNQQVNGSGGTFDVGTWVPNLVLSWTPPLQPLELDTNGVENADQFRLNFTDTATVTWVVDSNGNLSATAVVPATLDIKTNSVDNASQTVLNFEDTASVTWANPSGGIVKATAVIAPTAGSLTGAQAAAPSTLNLSTEGTKDWLAFTGTATTNPLFDDGLWNWKVLGGYLRRAIRFIYPAATTTLSTNTSSTLSLSATAGDDGAASGTAAAQPLSASTNTMIETSNTGTPYTNWGFALEVPADTTSRTLRLYAGFSPSGGSVSGTMTVTARLSDGSAADVTQTVTTSVSGVAWYKFTFVFNAASGGQRLNVSAMITGFGDSGTRIGFQAATLA
jgi:hypothetical protein